MPQQKMADKGSKDNTHWVIDQLSKYMGLKAAEGGKVINVYRRITRLKNNKRKDKSIIQLFCDTKLCPHWHCFYIHLAKQRMSFS